MLKNPRGAIFQKKKPLRDEPRPRGGGMTLTFPKMFKCVKISNIAVDGMF